MSIVLDRRPDDEVRLAVELTDMCETFGVLPRAGGLLDQDYYYIVLMYAVLRARAIKHNRDHPPQ